MVDAIKAILGIIADATDLAKKFPKAAVFLSLIVVFGAGFFVGKIDPPRNSPIGGLDLAQYCRSYGYSENTQQSCLSKIDLKAACDYDHRRSDLHIRFTSGDPNSGLCLDPHNESVGGIGDMPGFCQGQFRTSVGINAKPVDSRTWVCFAPIDKSVACTWRYQKGNLEARLKGGLWICYQ